MPQKCVGGQGSAPDSAGGAYNTRSEGDKEGTEGEVGMKREAVGGDGK